MKVLRIATRKSPLALWQAEEVARQLTSRHPELACELCKLTTEGDRWLDAPLAEVGGKGLFVKELEQALLEGRADIAVHSMKDVTTDLPPALHLPVIMRRASPYDAFVSNEHGSLAALPPGARVGTSSLRRKCQLGALRPDLRLMDVRGNVNTRLGRLDEGRFDALILAAAGLTRLGLGGRITEVLESTTLLPAIGQGAMGIECRAEDPEVEALIAPLNDPGTATPVAAERAISRRLGGGCKVPIAGFGEIEGQSLRLRGLVGRVDGRELLRGEQVARLDEAEALGDRVAEELLAQGAGEILAEFNRV